MRFLADENFPAAAVRALTAVGHDVAWVMATAPGSTDPDVLNWAAREQRILLTFDKDFGELARATQLPASCGVVLFRISLPPPNDAGTGIGRLVDARGDWAGHFSVIEPGRVRIRSLG
jgi:hypothetical protein